MWRRADYVEHTDKSNMRQQATITADNTVSLSEQNKDKA